MVTDFQTNKVYFSSWLPKSCPKLWDALCAEMDKRSVKYDFINGTNDFWCRDYMPIQIERERMVAYKYWPDYLVMKGLDNYITDSDQLLCYLKTEMPDVDFGFLDLILDGGNIVKCGDTIVMTEKVFYENWDKSRSLVTDMLQEHFCCELLFLPWDKSEEYGHSDGIIHYLGDNRVLLTNYKDFSEDYYHQFITCLEKKFEVVTLNYDVSHKHDNSWAYINYLQVGRLLFVPQLGIPEDQMAIEQLRAALSNDVEVIGIPAIEAVKLGGALNCVSWNIDAYLGEKATVKQIVSPYQKNAFSETVLYEAVRQKIDFELPISMWNEINNAFEIYWNEELGLGGNVYLDDMYQSIRLQLVGKGILFPDDKLQSIVNAICEFIIMIPGVIIQD